MLNVAELRFLHRSLLEMNGLRLMLNDTYDDDICTEVLLSAFRVLGLV